MVKQGCKSCSGRPSGAKSKLILRKFLAFRKLKKGGGRMNDLTTSFSRILAQDWRDGNPKIPLVMVMMMILLLARVSQFLMHVSRWTNN